MTEQRTVLVTGATGRVGGQVAVQLAATGVQVRGLTRDPAAAAAALDGRIEVCGGDLAEPSSLDAALKNVDAAFLVFPSVVADGAADELVRTLTRQVRRVVYLSAHGVPDPPAQVAGPDGSIPGSHAYLESLISAAGGEYTFLRSSGFAANTLGWAEQIRRSDVLRWFHPGATRALVHEADLAAVGVLALTEDGHDHRAYHLTGPEQLTQVEQLALIGVALGRALRFEEIDTAQAAAELFPGLPEDFVASIIDGQGTMVSRPETATDTIQRLLGRPALTFAQWTRDHAADFGG
ncbi:MAG TPA: NAD(P)H-binding protein [Segeticoccus sp.]|nr:NAD(P)H-binding protein [Segeticoccus sp.]